MTARSPSEMSEHLDRARAGADRARHQIDELRTSPAPKLPTDLRQRIPGWRHAAEHLRRELQLADEPAAIAPATAVPVAARPRRRRNRLLALGVPLLALAVGLVSCLALRSDDTQQATPTTIGPPPTDGVQVTAPPATAVPAAQPPPPTADPVIEPITGLTSWSSAIALPHAGNAARINDLVAHDGTLYAVGVTYLDDDRRPAVWRSADGETWELVETTGLDLPQSWMTQAISVGDRLVAIGDWRELSASGNNDYHAIGWTSADGVAWTRIDALPATPSYDEVNSVARVDDEAWIVGFSYSRDPTDITRLKLGPDGTVYGPDASDEQLADADSLIGWGRWGTMSRGSFVLRSNGTDVDDWQPVSMRGIEFTRPEAIGVTGDGTAVIAGTDADDRVTVWQRGTDGVWAALPGLVPSSASSVSGIAARDDTVVVNVYGLSGAVFATGAWTTLPGFTFSDVAALDDRFVGVSWIQVGETDDYLAHVAESSDGASWSGIELPPNQFMSALTTFEGRLMAGGSVRGGSEGEKTVPAVWIAGATDGAVEVSALTPADWQAPTAPPEPFADVLRYDGSSWTAELTNVDLGAARLSGDVDDLDLDRANDLTVANDGATWVATELHGVYRLGDGVWTRFGTEHGLPVEGVLQLAAGPGASVVAATRVGLAVFDGDRFTAPDLPPEITDPRVIDLLGDGTIVWAATASGLVSWDGTTWRRHGEAEGLPVPAVVGGSLPAGLALRLFPTDTGVVGQFPGVGVAAWDGSTWAVLDIPVGARVMTAGWDGSIIYSTVGDRERSSDIHRRSADGSTRHVLDELRFTTAAVARDGTLFVTENIGHLFEVRGDSVVTHESLAGTRFMWVGQATTIADLVVLKGGSAMFVYRNGSWAAHTTAMGLDYPLGGGDRGFSTGAIYRLAAAPDGAVWALSFEQLPEYD